MDQIARRCKEILQEHYGDRLQGLVLYGSVARDEPDPSSDIDLLVLLGKPFDYFRELRRIVDVLYPLQLESERHISVQPAAADEFERGAIQLYRNAKREGLVL
jgi:hypothetical protein